MNPSVDYLEAYRAQIDDERKQIAKALLGFHLPHSWAEKAAEGPRTPLGKFLCGVWGVTVEYDRGRWHISRAGRSVVVPHEGGDAA